MSEKNIIKCSICGKEQILPTVEYIRIVEKDFLRTCYSCREKGITIKLPYLIEREPHNKMLEYINSVRGVKDD